MTRDDIIRMALEAGFEIGYGNLLFPPGDYMEDVVPITDELERFFHAAYAAGAAAEREACAKVCDTEREELLWREGQTLPRGEPMLIHMAGAAIKCAEAIRARGEK